jgi:hypothetical protein
MNVVDDAEYGIADLRLDGALAPGEGPSDLFPEL